MRETTELRGTVTEGLGEGARFMALDWVVAECRLKLGFIPCPGTFNLQMHGHCWDRTRRRMRAGGGIGIAPAAGFCAARCFPVRIAGHLSAAGILPEIRDYPCDKFEIIAAINLREALGVADGDFVSIEVETYGSTFIKPCLSPRGCAHRREPTADWP